MTRRPGRRSVVGLLTAGVFLFGLAGGAQPAPPTTIVAALGLGPPTDDLAARRALAVAELTTRCLAAQGVRYRATPDPPPAIPDASLSPLSWAERWGFGVSTSLGGAAVEDASAAPDPDRRAAEPPGLPACANAAATAIYGLRDRVLTPLRADLAGLALRIDADPRTVLARRAWRHCVEAIHGRPPLDGRSRAAYAAWLLEWYGRQTAAAAADPDRLQALQADERRIAAATVRCESAYDAARSVAGAPYERAFVARFWRRLRDAGRVIREAESTYPALTDPSGAPSSTDTQPRSSWRWMSVGRSSARA